MKKTELTVEKLADWFYENAGEFVIDDEERVALKLLRDFEIRPRTPSHLFKVREID
jgi:hypothetical protein